MKGRIKRVSTVDGNVIKRPGGAQKNPEHWSSMQIARREMQSEGGKVYCGTCDALEGGSHRFELHHRRYDNFGNESLHDVILLCEPCHDAITARIRNKRYAAGDLRVEIEFSEPIVEQRYVPQPRQVTVTVERKAEPERPAFRPKSRY
jgi:5-methylcytosine-specific restriction endonuclease McrA